MTTMTSNRPVKHQGRELFTYTDPCPGMKNTDRVKEACGKCGGDGLYHAPSGWVIGDPYRKGQTIKGCFDCMGLGHRYVSVKTVRTRAKAEAFQREYGAEIEAQREAERVANWEASKLAEQMEAWDQAHAEQARRASLNNTTMGQPGDKLKGVEVTVEVAKSIEVPGFRYGTDYKMFLVLKTADGQVAKVFGSGSSLWSVERGDRAVIVSAKVKGTDEYQGQTQTELSHVKIARVEDDEVQD